MKLSRADKADIKNAVSVFAGECELDPRPPLIWGNPETDGPTCHLEWDSSKKQLAELRRAVRDIKTKE